MQKGAPMKAIVAPSYEREVPASQIRAPLRPIERGTPVKPKGVPQWERGAPVRPIRAPVRSIGTPVRPIGAPLMAIGAPSCKRGHL